MLILAPMQGLTELLFRRTFERAYPHAFDFAVSPFLSLTHGSARRLDRKMEDVLPSLNADSMPVQPQLLGHEPVEFVEMGNQLFDMGYREINWNMGCPMRRVAAKHRGSGILPYPDEVQAILDYVMPRLKPALSVKLRLGYYAPDEIDRIIPILNRFPLASVTIHPRIGKQMYSGRPDLERLSQVLPEIKHPVIYNGDICSSFDYGRIRQRFPQVRDVMIGRGALYNPLLPTLIRRDYPSDFDTAPTSADTLPTLGEFICMLTDAILACNMTQQSKVRKIKEYWCLLSKNLHGSEEQKRRLLHTDDLEAISRLIREMTK